MLKLRDIMTTDVVTVTPETSLRDAMELLAARHVSGAPVVSGNTLVGVVSATDLLGFAASAAGARSAREDAEEWGDCGESEAIDDAIEREDEPGSTFFSDLWDNVSASVRQRMAMVEGSNALEAHEVGEAMTRPLVTLPPDATVSAAADLMRRKGIHRVLVIEHGVLAGIVSSMDITRAVADHKLETRRYVFPRSAGNGHRRWS